MGCSTRCSDRTRTTGFTHPRVLLSGHLATMRGGPSIGFFLLLVVTRGFDPTEGEPEAEESLRAFARALRATGEQLPQGDAARPVAESRISQPERGFAPPRYDEFGRYARPMPAKKKTRRRQTPHGRRIDAAPIVSVGQDRDTGEAVIRLRDADGKLVALCLPPRQFGTLARGVLGLALSRGACSF